MNLPTEDSQKEYLKSQIKAMKDMIVKGEMSVAIYEKWLEEAKDKEEIREYEDTLEEEKNKLEGYHRYFDVLNEFATQFGLKHDLPSKKDRLELYNKKLEEVRRANYKGVISSRLQEVRVPKDKEEERVIEDEKEAIKSAQERNEQVYSVVSAMIDKL